MTFRSRLLERGSIRRRLTASVIALALVPILILALGSFELDRIHNAARQIEVASSLRMSAFIIASQLNSHLANPKDYKQATVIDELQRMRRALELLQHGSAAEGLAPVRDPEVERRLEEARRALELYEDVTQEAFASAPAIGRTPDEREEVTQEVLGSAYGFLALSNLATRSLEAHATQAMQRLRLVQALSVLLALVVLVATLWTVRRFILQPIPSFFDAFARVRDGRYGEQLSVPGDNEFTHLAEGFNAMSTALERAHHELLFKQTEVLEKNAALARSSKLQSQFVANMSHELRTPLNAILGYTGLFERGVYGEFTDKMREPLRGIDETARNLLQLINDILDVAKSDAGRMGLDIESFCVANLVQEVGGMLRPLAISKGLECEIDSDAHVPTVTSDREKIRRILVNIGANAIKFTTRGGIRVELLPEHEGRFGVAVHDSGCGIAANDLETIFEDFRQLDGSHTREQEGTGLGLAISRRLARQLGGEIEVESTVGTGSTFTLRLPVFVRVQDEALPAH